MFCSLKSVLARYLGFGTSPKTDGQTRFRPKLEHCEHRTVPAALGGVIWLDANANASLDPGEGMVGIDVTLTASDGQSVRATTDADGEYAFPDVAPGTYTVALSTATGGSLGSVNYTGGASAPPVAAFALPNALNVLVVRPRAEIEADIERAKQALAQADLAVTVALAVQDALAVQVTKADDRVTALTREFGANPTDAQKAQIAEAKATADRIYADYKDAGAAVVRAITNRDGIRAMLNELIKELNRKID